jgi:sigma-E factor negative regulatory protein RseA
MSEQQRQQLSALVDGEIDPALERATVSSLQSNDGLQGAWERYHLIGAAIRSEQLREDYRQIASLVSARIADEPVPLAPAAVRRRRRSRLGPFAGAALAASAAFFAVFAVPQLFDPSPGTQAPAAVQVTSSAPRQFRLPSPTQRWHLDKPALENKLDRFLVNHQAQSPASDMKGFLPYATLVGYETRR